MRLLVADIGNTDIKFALFENKTCLYQWRLKDSHCIWRLGQEKEIAEIWFQSFRENALSDDVDIQGLIFSTVLLPLGQGFLNHLQQVFHLPEQMVVEVDSKSTCFPVDFQYYASGQLGADRLVNVCAAHELYPDKSCLVVDFGTATTLDVLSDGVYQGGIITVGFQTFWESLSVKTAKLPILPVPDSPLSMDRLGNNTVSCLQIGLMAGYRGLLDELFEFILKFARLKSIRQELFYIATGGLAESVISLCGLENAFQVIRPTLTLEGLLAIYHWQKPPNGAL